MKEFVAFLIIAFFMILSNYASYDKGQQIMLKQINELPSAMDVYQGKTTLQYTVINGVKMDSVVVFK